MKSISIYFILLLTGLMNIIAPAQSQSPRMKDKFYLGYLNLPYEAQFTGESFRGYNDSPGSYEGNPGSMLMRPDTTLNENSVLLSREKITRPAYGQRSTYQAEYSREELVGKVRKPGYGYKHGGGSIYTEDWQGESGISGRYCQRGVHSPDQYIVDSLYENLEQVNDVSDNHLTSDRKQMLPGYSWYIKPRMRIPQSFANDSSNWEKIVVRIEVYNFKGELVSLDDIRVFRFLNDAINYDGSYKEYFNFLDSQYPLTVRAEDLTQGAGKDNLYDSKVDYRVFWPGEVDVWLDYVRVDDEWAHFLLSPEYEEFERRTNYVFFHKIKEEVNAFSSGNGGNAYYYLDEYCYNNIPCIREVNRIIKSINPNAGLICTECKECMKNGLRNQPSGFDVNKRINE